MISYNSKPINIEHFPDGTQRLFDIPVDPEERGATITWAYENDEETLTLYYLVSHIREKAGSDVRIKLFLGYVPNARMDRVSDDTEVFTLKYFGRIINALNFSDVYALDVHSNVTLGAIDRIRLVDVKPYIKKTIDTVRAEKGGIVLYFPDAGAMDRYKKKKLVPENLTVFYGNKVRDQKNGQIIGMTAHRADGTKLEEGDLKGYNVLMIDDIISYGGTLAYSGDMLKSLGAQSISAYASHVEKSIFDENKGTLLARLKNGTVEKLYSPCTIPLPESKFIEKL